MLQFFLLLLGAFSFFTAQAPVSTFPANLQPQHAATHHINFENPLEHDSCSATAVGPHTLLTAGHCILATNKIKIDGEEAHVVVYIFDNADHMLIVTDATFKAWLPINQNALKDMHPSDPLHFWGNPGHARDVYRIGNFEKWDESGDVSLALLQIPAYPGDSGSGILNDAGEIVAVLSMGNQSAEVAVLPFAFTAEQLTQIK
jgi:hypothetical protein